MTLHAQAITMGSMILGGIYLGVALETYRRFSVWWKNIHFLSYLFEICFWLSQTTILYIVLFKVNYGELRLYVFLACLLGFSIYVVLFKKIYVWLLELIIRIVSATVNGIIYTIHLFIVKPIIWMIRLVNKVVQFLWKCLYAVLLFFVNILLLPIKLIIMVLKLILPNKWIEKCSQFATRCSTIVNNYLLKLKQFFKKGGN